jgi:hypothetical protein
MNSAPMMSATKDVCLLCTKEFYGKQKFLRCCGPCASRFHLSCLQFSETEYAYYTDDSGASTYKCTACFKTWRSQRNDDTPLICPSSSTSDLPKKAVSCKRALVLPPVFDSDKYEALSVQLEMGSAQSTS